MEVSFSFFSPITCSPSPSTDTKENPFLLPLTSRFPSTTKYLHSYVTVIIIIFSSLMPLTLTLTLPSSIMLWSPSHRPNFGSVLHLPAAGVYPTK